MGLERQSSFGADGLRYVYLNKSSEEGIFIVEKNE